MSRREFDPIIGKMFTVYDNCKQCIGVCAGHDTDYERRDRMKSSRLLRFWLAYGFFIMLASLGVYLFICDLFHPALPHILEPK